MKKVLVLLFAIFASTAMFAQDLHWQYTTVGLTGMNNIKITSVFALDGVQIYNGEGMQGQGGQNIEIGVFDQDGVCRGAKLPVWDSKNNRYQYNLQIYGNSGFTYTFRVYDHGIGEEMNYEEAFENNYVHNGNMQQFGSRTNPVVLNFHDPDAQTGIDLTISDNNWHLIASPVGQVESASVTNLRNSGYDFYYFDQAQELEWINDRPEDFDPEAPVYAIENLEAGKGYLYAHGDAEPRTLTFPGVAYTTSVTVTLNKTADAAGLDFPGWNLVGNPYNVEAYIGERSFYRMENGAFLPEATGAINRMEGVFVIASEDGEELTFSTEAKANVGNLALNLRKDNKTIDRAIVSFGQGRQLPKLQLFSSSKLYIPQDGQDYAIVAREGMGEMPLSFKAESNGTYSLNLSTENVEFSYLHLIDNLTGADQDLLANPSYSFSANTTDYASRFRLVFATGNDEDSFAFFSNGSLFVNNEGNAVLQVVDVTGRIIKSESINGCANVSINAAPGVYMVRLVNGDNTKVQKVVK